MAGETEDSEQASESTFPEYFDQEGLEQARAEWDDLQVRLTNLKAERDALRGALTGMLESYIGLKNLSLFMARSDRPGWMPGMTAEDDIHVQAARKALALGEG